MVKTMAKRPTAPTPRPANLSAQQMREAIPKIKRRLEELRAFDISTVADRQDPRIGVLSNKLEALLQSVFGADTVEYDRYHWKVTHLDTASLNVMYETPLREIHDGLRHGIETAVLQLEGIVAEFDEELGDAGDTPATKAIRAYEGFDINPAIERAAGQLHRDGHYASAVEDAVKALNALVRLNSGVDDRDGTALMEMVFSPKSPILKFNNLKDQSDHDEQKGFMMMFSGAVAGLRNPRAHKIISDEPGLALEFVAFVSLLAQLADRAKR
jgi:uncharacterized protein (TIGR02391 family)